VYRNGCCLSIHRFVRPVRGRKRCPPPRKSSTSPPRARRTCWHERLRSNSLLLQEPEDGARTAQDIVAAARADYARLVATLYEFGHFAPVVSITLDGREASGLSPFDVPAQIGRVRIEVEPGPAFSFGTAEIGPLAGGTELPEEFRPGGPASTPVLQRTTSAAIERWRIAGRAVAEVGGQRIVARHRDAALDATIRIEPGPVVSFGQLDPARSQSRMRHRADHRDRRPPRGRDLLPRRCWTG
jgi:translocation and assembly module TamA